MCSDPRAASTQTTSSDSADSVQRLEEQVLREPSPELTTAHDCGSTIRAESPSIAHNTDNLSSGTTVSTLVPGSFIARDTIWLAGQHDGYPRTNFREYIELRRPSKPEKAPIDVSPALHQIHLTFGLLEAVLEEKIPESLLLHRIPRGDIVMSTRRLPAILRDFRHRIRTLHNEDTNAHREWFERVESTLQQAHTLLMIGVAYRCSPFLRNDLGVPIEDAAPILYMIASIGQALTTSSYAFNKGSSALSWSLMITKRFNPYENEMLTNGWCPFTIGLLKKDVCALGYASTCRPHIRESVGIPGHDGCSEERCVMNTIDTTTYSNRHVTEACNCLFSKPPLGEVVQSLSDWKVPVVKIRTDPIIDVACISAAVTPYVAISHVWADGLGSVTEKGLPTCQLRRLATLTNQIVEGGALWMDSLCVPDIRDMRKRAIGLMGQTYKDAAAVLVIDSGIRSCSLNAPMEEKLLRILTSSWMQRLWTAQEALLARLLIFEFSDGLTTIPHIMLPGRDDQLDPLQMYLSGELLQLLRLRGPGPRLGLRSFGFGDVTSLLQVRTTSRMEDETLAIASLLNVDAFELVNQMPDRRMKTLFLLMKNIDSEVIFLDGPKLGELGFRWTPKTFMVPDGGNISTRTPDAVCTPEGLFAKYFCICFEKITLKNCKPDWCIRDLVNNVVCFACAIDYAVDYTAVSVEDAEEYTCNAVFLSSPEQRGSVAKAGVAVMLDMQNPVPIEGELVRLKASYVKPLAITMNHAEGDLSLYPLQKIVDVRTQVGWLDVCLT
ncbi:hypothetical protein OBBRIDRAFT_835831 [Obba rivulosa]|uniref:Heterokaryon incompatibility domain-containing protein n=1 Tax=Obba rivulosa TaxID=1052685 RepID=A0A8E2B1E3_9APHY|nr:hypothetical protein OBBRIDRAFT_835831 [Obba rivulosa]